ncbi:haloacid dehalogenase-like hydrolase family member protein [Theileria equi strain WA]|uniref:Haloacid dehalogenase-like hydrolase family member protein n=1 Tax=Theileria equi strain WA TaxID=1537102 RepID=L0AZG2_THEEQ|nr:haloacid dehalogenase-like hydrolase family member protein [Theileria equi strain WA]AFZ80663.1 haloacid dehalogenase-like hydrolase family member protein [Theileria equi strain WA]|eukprot:XP_004830329.1 haloacid dehalogenase-like hydrolase family member protein [Theileria equi strain WA]
MEASSPPETPMEKPQYFGIDIDSTLFTHNEEAFEKNVNAFAKVRKMGYTPFLCTGRSRNSGLGVLGTSFAEKTGYQGYPGVYQNGAVVYDEHGNLIYSKPFSREFVKTLAEHLEAENLKDKCIFYTETASYSLAGIDEKLMEFTLDRKLPIPEVTPLDELIEKEYSIIKYYSFDVSHSGLREGVDYVQKITRSNWVYTLSPSGVTKALGVSKLLEHYGLSPNEYGFIGDGDNDTEAMHLSRGSFAVANAKELAKKCAKWVLTKTHDEGGFSEAMGLVYGV